MKARKRLAHNGLITECVEQLKNRFPPNASIIKRRIESLIERDYLSRSPEDRYCFDYINTKELRFFL